MDKFASVTKLIIHSKVARNAMSIVCIVLSHVVATLEAIGCVSTYTWLPLPDLIQLRLLQFPQRKTEKAGPGFLVELVSVQAIKTSHTYSMHCRCTPIAGPIILTVPRPVAYCIYPKLWSKIHDRKARREEQRKEISGALCQLCKPYLTKDTVNGSTIK